MLLSKLLVKLMGSSTSGSKLRLTLPAALFRLPVTLFLFPPFVILGSHKLQDAMPVSLSDPSLGSFPVKTCQEQWFSICQTRCLQQLVVVRLQRFRAKAASASAAKRCTRRRLDSISWGGCGKTSDFMNTEIVEQTVPNKFHHASMVRLPVSVRNEA